MNRFKIKRDVKVELANKISMMSIIDNRLNQETRKELKQEGKLEAVLFNGPKWCFRNGILPGGWRAGFSKPTLESRTLKRRTLNKNKKHSR